MDDLKTTYRNALPARIAELERMRSGIGVRDSTADATVRRIAHLLRGSGGTYGFPQVTAAAAHVEDARPVELAARVDDLVAVLRSVAAGETDGPVVPSTARTAGGAVSMRVLVVDDDPQTRMLVAHILGVAGHTVTEAADAAAAAAAMDAARPDVILMDVMLGDDDGINTAVALRDRSRTAGTAPHVVFLTGVVRPDQLDRINTTGAAGVIRKPFDPTTFIDEFHRALPREAR